jgi:hypothetical protein
MDQWCEIAALNNARWCDVVCRSHGAHTEFGENAWTSPTRTPPYYPDAVTLAADLNVPDLLSRVDISAGCSIKDSFASLDLTGDGFRVLFDAQWIVNTGTRLPTQEGGARWELVSNPDDFATWVEAWRGEDGPKGVLRSEILERNSVAVLAARAGDRVIAGSVLSGDSNVVGISNFFVIENTTQAGWSGCLALARSLNPTAVIVGYESGDGLAVAQQAGFETAGPLRVWIHDG